MKTIRQTILVVLLVASIRVDAQIKLEEPTSLAVQNINKLEMTLTLDHAVYVPGEVMIFTVSVRNPTSQSLEIPNPFWPKRAGIDLLEKDSERARELHVEYMYLSPHPSSDFSPRDDEKTLLQPFQTITESIRSDEVVFSSGPVLPRMAAPDRPGAYRVIYSYAPRAHADFTVAQPILERFTSIAFKAGERKNEQGKTEPVLQKINAIALAVGKQHLVLLTLLPTIRYPSIKTPIGGEWTNSDAMNFSPYERVAELTEPVTALELAPSTNAGKVLVRWSSASGERGESEHSIEHSMRRAN